MIPGPERLALALELGGIDGVAALRQPPAGPLVRARGEKYLQGGVRKHHRPDVPPVHDHALRVRRDRLALLHVHPVAHFRDGGDFGDPPGDPVGADRIGHVHAGDFGSEHIVHENQAYR